MPLRVTLSDSIIFIVRNEYGEGAAAEIELVLQPVYHLPSRGVHSNGTF